MSNRVRQRPVARVIAAAAALAVVFGAAACGSDSDTASSSGTESAESANSADSSPSQQPTENEEADSEASGDDSDASGEADTDSDNEADSETDGDASTEPLTIYSGQHESFAQTIADAFTAESGIEIDIRAGDGAELANQIIEEGDGSPADLFLTEEPGPVGLLDTKGLLSAVSQDTLDQVDQRLVPSTGNWMPYAARSRVIFYDPELISVEDLPESILDLTDEKWKGEFAYAPSGAFTSTVSYLIDSIGSDKTLEWLKGIKANGINEQKNGKVRDSIEAGQHPFGLSNHYYWYFLARDEGGAENLSSKVYYFDHVDAGGLLLPSGAAVIKASKHQDEAQQFLTWLGSADGGQQVVGSADAAQYPVAPGVTSDSGLPPLADLQFPEVDASVYSDTTEAKDLIIKAGIA